MKQVRISYIVSTIVTFILTLLFDSWYLAAVFVMQILFPLLLFCLLRFDVRRTSVTLDYSESCKIGESAPLRLNFSKRHFSVVTGLIEVNVEWDNLMLGEHRTDQIRFYLNGKEETVSVPLDFYCCGEIVVRQVQVRCYDVFGICDGDIARFENKRIYVQPLPLGIRVMYERISGGSMENEWETLPKKGNDVGEIYDLREFQPGDSMRSIHWKMSAKLGELIAKENGDTLHTESFVLLDLGRSLADGTLQDKKVLSAVVAFGQICCRNLLDNGVNFMTAYASKEQLHLQAVSNQSELMNTLYTWMGIQMPSQNGTAMKLCRRDMPQKTISHIIYITGGKFPEELFTRQSSERMTAVCITEDGDTIQYAEQENIHMIEIPYRMLSENKNVILI